MTPDAGYDLVQNELAARLYNRALPSRRSGLFYNMFPYPAKIAPESIAVYIAAHTNPGDTVLDVFGGSGTTGLAALMCEHPTRYMKELACELGFEPQWGARNAVVYELGTYGAFAAKVVADPPDPDLFSKAVRRLLKSVERELPGIYDTRDGEGNKGTIRHIVHSDVLQCPRCGQQFTYYAGMVRFEPLRIERHGECPHCTHRARHSDFPYVLEDVYDKHLGTVATRRKRVPVLVYGLTDGRRWRRPADARDIHGDDAGRRAPSYGYAPKEIVWGELRRAGYHTGITHLHHFYTERNFAVMSALWERSESFEPRTRDALRLLLLSYNAAHSTLMSRVVVKRNSKDFVLTGAQSGVLYISSLPVEKNIFIGVRRKLKSFTDAFSYLVKCSGRIDVFNMSSRSLLHSDGSIDYVFTDPPFGDFIPYAEVNQINELWLGVPTDRTEEVIISESQGKDVARYQKMMTDVFREIARVLKDEGLATVVFHASKASVWNSLREAYSDAGFVVDATTILDKQQASFKQVVSRASVQGDPVILLSKGRRAASRASSRSVLDEMVFKYSGTADKRQIYAHYIRECLRRGLRVDFDAKAAYQYMTSTREARGT